MTTALSNVHWTIKYLDLSLKVVFLFQSFLVLTVVAEYSFKFYSPNLLILRYRAMNINPLSEIMKVSSVSEK